jgi:hypothetical protein
MKQLMLAALVFLAPVPVLATTWSGVPLVDQNCETKVQANPDAHTAACLLQCAGSGYGILSDGTWIKLDQAGNEMAVSALKATTRKDHIRVNVTGERKGDVIHVRSLTLST